MLLCTNVFCTPRRRAMLIHRLNSNCITIFCMHAFDQINIGINYVDRALGIDIALSSPLLGGARGVSKEKVATFLQHCSGWSALKMASACRMHVDIALQLRRGVACTNPDLLAPHELLDAVNAAKADPTDPVIFSNWPQAHPPLPVCKTTVQLVVAVTKGWSPCRHWLYHPGFRKAVRTVMMVMSRLDKNHARDAADVNEVALESNGGDNGDNCGSVALHATRLPILPKELWEYLLRFLVRHDFELN